MEPIYVQFSDATEAVIVSAFSIPQDGKAFPNQGTVTPDDPRWAVYYESIVVGAREAWPTPTKGGQPSS
jgi:hypothetical protein